MSLTKAMGKRKNHLIGLGLAAAYLIALLLTAKAVGYSRDEGFYFSAARSYLPWFELLIEDPGSAVENYSIQKYWKYNHEHPALMKVLFGFSNQLFTEKLVLLSPSTSFRLPGMLAAMLAVYLIYIWGASAFNKRAGLYGAVAFAFMPRVFYHAHLACFDMAIAAVWLLVCYLYWRSLSSWKFGLAAGAAFGIALCIKLNAFFIPFVLGFHYVCLLAYRRLNRPRLPVPKAWAFVFGLVLAPPIFIGHWPWLWYDTWEKLTKYIGFHSGHSHYNAAWFGENIIKAPTPIAMPMVMTLITVPTVIIALFAAGSFIRLRHHFPARLERVFKSFPKAAGPSSSDGLDLLLFLSVMFPIALISLPSVPVFGGTKHWMPAYPFFAILAGVAASRLTDVASTVFKRIPPTVAWVLTIALLLAPPVHQTVTSHPFGLESYVPLVGGAPGAATMGMTRQFWGYTTMGVLPWLNENVPDGGGVEFHDTTYSSVKMFHEEGTLRRNIRPAKLGSSQIALLHHELHMIRNEAWIWNDYKTFTPAHVLTYQGVPIISVFERPPKRGSLSEW
ncbi:MAG: hypothetical protein GY847_34305 [Proteobacteria bacterium]|nr:hypothetical protein [Pseudomonadota bacterium]